MDFALIFVKFLKEIGKNMKTLGINTTNSFAKVSINTGDKIFSNPVKNPYSESIMATLQKTLDDADLNIQDIDAFGVVTGPGSFTGIRIGMAVLKGILCGLNKPCIEINSFELVSYNINDDNFVVVLDSGNSDFYYAIYKNRKIAEMGFCDAPKMLEYAKEQNVKVYYSQVEQNKFSEFEFMTGVATDEDALSKILFQKAEKEEFTKIQSLSPVYIKLSQAEVGLQQKLNENLCLSVAGSNDVNALEIIDKQCFDSAESYSANSFANELAEPSKHYYVAKYDGLVVGYVGVQVLGDELNLLKIAVLPQYRKLGIGAKLMKKTFELKNENHLNSYFLEVRKSNETAQKFYQKFGFVTKSTRKNYYDGKEDALVMFFENK